MEDNKALTMEEIISRVQEIPPFPQTIIRIMEITKNPDAGAKELEEEIIKDQGLTAKILQLANSAFYHGRRNIDTVKDAAVLLGFEAVRTMVLTTVIGKFMEKELPGYALEKEALWKQSQISAIMTRAVARKVGYKKIDQAYTAGLLRDIGKVILDQYVANAYEEINALVEKGYTFIEAEEQVLGFNHGQVGAKIAEKWNLPQELAEVIATHHHPQDAVINPQLVYITHVADSLIMMMGIHIGIDGLAYEFFSQGAQVLELNEKKLSEIMSEVVDIIENEPVFLEL